MKISSRDRIQAIKLSLLYRKDYQRYVKKRDQDGELDAKLGPPWDPRKIESKAGKRLCEKWGIQWPVDPDSSLEPLNYVTKEPVANVPEWVIDGIVCPVSFPTEDELMKPSHIGVADSDGYRVVTHLNGKLCLLIDTSYPSDMTMEALREFIKYYAKDTEDREGHPEADPWKVYLMHRSGINLWEITKTLHPDDTEIPAYNKTSASHYGQVKRAKSKAYRMIEYVEREANKSKRLPK